MDNKNIETIINDRVKIEFYYEYGEPCVIIYQIFGGITGAGQVALKLSTLDKISSVVSNNSKVSRVLYGS